MALRSVTSSRGSASGRTRSGRRDGRTTGRFGRGAARASRSVSPGSVRVRKTSDTSGRIGMGSSRSAVLQSSLESRLRVRLSGSTLFKMTWKERVTPLRRSILALRASALRTSGSGCTSWQTPVANDATGSQYAYGPKKPSGSRPVFLKLSGEVQLASWPTPMAGSPATENYNEAGDTCNGRKTRLLISGWATPTTRDHKDGEFCPNVPENALLGRQVWQASGPTATGSPAATGSSGQLNPAHARWLMGLPVEWDACAVMGMLSSPRSRKPS